MSNRSLLLITVLLLACGDDDGASSTTDAGAHPPGTHDAATNQHDAADDPGPPVTMDAGAPTDFGGSEVCTACLDRVCSAESTTCHDEAACGALVDCARACSSADAGDCRSACVDEHPTGLVAYNELVLCMGQRCRAECPFVAP